MSRLGGVGYAQLAEEIRLRHQIAFPKVPSHRAHRNLIAVGNISGDEKENFTYSILKLSLNCSMRRKKNGMTYSKNIRSVLMNKQEI